MIGIDAVSVETFRPEWSAELLTKAPLIAPARQFLYPQQIAGEEDALARGALLLMVRPASGGTFLATCALGFTDASMPTGVFACPNPREMCAVAGGYAYVIDTSAPEQSTHLALKPVTAVKVLAAQRLLLFAGFHSIVAWGEQGLAWETGRLSWEGVRMGTVESSAEGEVLRGFGWDLMADKEVPFTVDLASGHHQGGAAPGRRF